MDIGLNNKKAYVVVMSNARIMSRCTIKVSATNLGQAHTFTYSDT